MGILLLSVFDLMVHWLYLNNTSIALMSYRFFNTSPSNKSSKVDGFIQQLVQNLQNGKTQEKEKLVFQWLAPCPMTSPHLVGPLRVEFNRTLTLSSVRTKNAALQDGGRFKPKDCFALQKVAVIIPFRNRHEHLTYWLSYLHPILQRQQLDYGIYVINQRGQGKFNRAKLMNVGYAEALKEYDYDCFVFSDVDLVPMDDRNTYGCFGQPRHLSVAIDKFHFKLPYMRSFGGVSSLSKQQYLTINGFSNSYWGWGGEDDDIANRVVLRGMSISRPNSLLGRYRMIRHGRDAHNEADPERFNKVINTRLTMDKDGINSLKYTVMKIERDKLFTLITVDINPV